MKAGCDRGNTLPLITQLEVFHKTRWEPKDTIVSYTSRIRNLYQIHRDVAVHILVDRLPDCYKSEGQAAKQLNLPFIETTSYLLANIKDTVNSGDNLSGQALMARGRHPLRKTSTQRLRDRERGSRSSSRGGRTHPGSRSPYSRNTNSRNTTPRNVTCNWCKHKGHYERDCQIRQQQFESGAAKYDSNGLAYLVKVPSIRNLQSHQANFTQTQSTPQQDQTSQYPAHLLLARASYINNQNQVKDTLSWILDSGASQHFTNNRLDFKEYKRFRETQESLPGRQYCSVC